MSSSATCMISYCSARSLEGLNLRMEPVSKQLVDAGPDPAAVVA